MLQGIEYWVPVKEDPDYEVSNYGNVRNVLTGKILAQSDNKKDGYARVSLHRTKYYVHRLVVHAFFDCDLTDKDVNHIDGNKHNNHISNLELCTRKENIRHAVDNGLFKRTIRDTVTVVRCRHCVFRNEEWCQGRPPDFYCANGRRE